MHARWWYRGEKEQNINKIKLFISKTIKMYTKVLKQNLCFEPILLRGFLSLRTRGCKVIL